MERVQRTFDALDMWAYNLAWEGVHSRIENGHFAIYRDSYSSLNEMLTLEVLDRMNGRANQIHADITDIVRVMANIIWIGSQLQSIDPVFNMNLSTY